MTFKAFAIATNISLIGVALYFFYENGMPTGNEALLLFFMLFATVISILDLMQIRSVSPPSEESTTALARKALRAKLKRAADE